MKNKMMLKSERLIADSNLLLIEELVKMNVTAHNCFLRNQVNDMTLETLLRHTHPLDRPEFAKKLHMEYVLPGPYESLISD